MQYLILYAHPNPKSFNAAIKERVEAKLKKDNKKFETRDLYALNWDPVLKGSDFVGFKSGNIPEDIKKEQAAIKKADVIILIHPIWWFGMPSILKGYIDRVFSYGFAYEVTASGPKGLLEGKKVVILNTTGGSEKDYLQYGFKDAISKTFQNGIFGFCGLAVALHQFFYAVPAISDEARKEILNSIDALKF